jgi:hypothetical protein
MNIAVTEQPDICRLVEFVRQRLIEGRHIHSLDATALLAEIDRIQAIIGRLPPPEGGEADDYATGRSMLSHTSVANNGIHSKED